MFQLRIDPVGPAFDLTIPIDIVIGTMPLKHKQHNYANVNINSSPSSSHYANVNVNAQQGTCFHGGGSRQPIGVPVLPVHGSFISNPAYDSNLTNQASGSQPGSSSHGSIGLPRPSSRASSAPSTASTTSHSRCESIKCLLLL